MATHPFILLFYAVSGFLNTMIGIFHKKTTENNYFINKSYTSSGENVFIEDQNEKKELRYGSKSFAHSGCGAAAVYNALKILGHPLPLADIIRHFEGHGASFFAAFGTAPQAAAKYLRSLGFFVENTSNRKKFKELAECSDVMIFTIMNNRSSLRRMLHTMCIERIPENPSVSLEGSSHRFTVHNSHGRSENYVNFDEMMLHLGDGSGLADGVYMAGVRKC
ncbi:MAG: hypothetical protein IJU87_02990 [Lachnospiraceae bacterium]|nr:hypothetical protein [Lachnospiraceae bacterium]